MKISKEDNNSKKDYIWSHIAIIKLFAIWGILESIIVLLTKGNKYTEILIHIGLFSVITILAYIYPESRENLI
jgi:hypothetical protein